MLVGVRSRASAGEVSVACSHRRWKLAVTCACVVCHCACVLALPMGAITSGGLHVIGRIAPDQLGLNLPDRVFRLIGNKPRLEAGRPWRPSSLPAMPHRRLLAPRPIPAPVLPAPMQQGPASDSLPVFIGARLTRARAAGPRQRRPSGVYRRPPGSPASVREHWTR